MTYPRNPQADPTTSSSRPRKAPPARRSAPPGQSQLQVDRLEDRAAPGQFLPLYGSPFVDPLVGTLLFGGAGSSGQNLASDSTGASASSTKDTTADFTLWDASPSELRSYFSSWQTGTAGQSGLPAVSSTDDESSALPGPGGPGATALFADLFAGFGAASPSTAPVRLASRVSDQPAGFSSLSVPPTPFTMPVVDRSAALAPLLSGLDLGFRATATLPLTAATNNVTDLVVQLQPGFEGEAANILGGARAFRADVDATHVDGLYEVHASTFDLGSFAAQLAHDPRVASVEVPSRIFVSATPNDPSYTSGQMWGLNGAYGMKANEAWDRTTGSTKVTIAVLDTGIDYNHPDLYKNIWVNQGEIPTAVKNAIKATAGWDIDGDGLITFWDLNDPRNQGTGKIVDTNSDGKISATDVLAATNVGGWANGISDDGDTYKDDIVGWDWVNNDNKPFDDNRHGTHVAGTIGATGNNSLGVVGVNWKTQLMALKVMDSGGSGLTSNATQAVYYAADHGARVSNNSWGGSGFSGPLYSAISYAGTKGHVFVAAAGNYSSNNDTTGFYPAGFSLANIVAVAATTSSGAKASFSNYGLTTVDLGAPGVGILSTVPGGGYLSMQGTSMATPQVAGVFGLVFAQNPGWTFATAINRVLSTVTPLTSLAGKTVTGGLVNAAAATLNGPEIQVLDGATDLLDGSSTVTMSTLTGVAQNKTFTVKNVGTSTLTLNPMISLPLGFSLASGFGSTSLAAGVSTTFTVRLDAASAGTYSGQVSFANSDSDENPFNFTLKGVVSAPAAEIQTLNGAINISDNTGTVSFGTTIVGVAVSKTFTVKNIGTAVLTLSTSIQVPAGFTLVAGFGSTTLAPGASTTFTVNLKATTAGSYSGKVSFANSDSDENPFDFTVTGTVTTSGGGR